MEWYRNLLTIMALFGLFFVIIGLYLHAIVTVLIGIYLVGESIFLWIIKR